MRLEGVGYGFLVPIYFVVTGMNFDLDSLLTPEGIGLAALFLGLFLIVRGVPALLWVRDLAPRETLSLAVFSATGLPLIVAIVGIGIERGAIGRDVGTSLIGAGMISVLVLPLIATALYIGTGWIGPALLFSAYGLLGLLAALVTRETWGKTERDEVEALERAIKAEGTEPVRRTETAGS